MFGFAWPVQTELADWTGRSLEKKELHPLIVIAIFAGVFLQVFRPFGVGDFITAAGITGTVEEIGMFVTSLLAPDNVRNIVPNGKLFGDTIQNYSVHGYRRVELVAQLDNSADVGRAIGLLKEGLKRVPNQFEGMGGDVEVLEFSERGPRRRYVHTPTPTTTGRCISTPTA